MNDGFVGEALRRYRTGIANTTTHEFLSVDVTRDDIMVVWPRTVLLCDTRCFCSSPSFIILAGLRCWLISSRRIVQRSCNGIIFCWSFSCWSGLLWHAWGRAVSCLLGETGPCGLLWEKRDQRGHTSKQNRHILCSKIRPVCRNGSLMVLMYDPNVGRLKRQDTATEDIGRKVTII